MVPLRLVERLLGIFLVGLKGFGSWSRKTTQDIFAVMRPVSPLVGWAVGMVMVGFMDWVRGFWKRPRYALPNMLLLWGFSCM